jgi:hypothetical protein
MSDTGENCWIVHGKTEHPATILEYSSSGNQIHIQWHSNERNEWVDANRIRRYDGTRKRKTEATATKESDNDSGSCESNKIQLEMSEKSISPTEKTKRTIKELSEKLTKSAKNTKSLRNLLYDGTKKKPTEPTATKESDNDSENSENVETQLKMSDNERSISPGTKTKRIIKELAEKLSNPRKNTESQWNLEHEDISSYSSEEQHSSDGKESSSEDSQLSCSDRLRIERGFHDCVVARTDPDAQRQLDGKFFNWVTSIINAQSTQDKLSILSTTPQSFDPANAQFYMNLNRNYGTDLPNDMYLWTAVKKSRVSGTAGFGLFAITRFEKNDTIGVYMGVPPKKRNNSVYQVEGVADAIGGVNSFAPALLGMHFMNDPTLSTPPRRDLINAAIMTDGMVIATKTIESDKEILVEYLPQRKNNPNK